jgi:hypothetical protein
MNGLTIDRAIAFLEGARKQLGGSEPMEVSGWVTKPVKDDLLTVLRYLVESEAKSHYQLVDETGKGYSTYESVRRLIQHFGFTELQGEDDAWRKRCVGVNA